MQKIKKISVLVLVLLFTAFAFISYSPVFAAQKQIVPQIGFATAPITEYTVGDRVKFDISAPNYGGRVEYRVILWEDSKKTAQDLWNSSNGYPNRYYSKWQPYGNGIFTLGWPINEPGSYRITVYVKRIGVPNNKAALKGFNCDSYKESVAFVVKPKTEQIVSILDKEGQNYGSTDSSKPEMVNGDVKIMAKNITYSNVNIKGSLYISADNTVLNNVNADTIFIDPGKDGSAELNNINAKNIKVLSGAQNSIHLKNVLSDNLRVAASSIVRIQTEGTTKIINTSVTSSVVLSNHEGTFGKVTVSKGEAGKPEVEFDGIFYEPIVVNTEAVIKTAQNASISKLIVSPENKETTITLLGAFINIEIAKETKIELDGNIKNMNVGAKASINTSTSSSIEALTKNGNAVNLSGSGKVVEVNTGSTGDVSAPGGSTGTSTEPVIVEAAGVVLSNGNIIAGTRVGQTNEFSIDLTGYPRTIGVKTSFTVNRDCQLEVMGNTFQFSAHNPKVFGPSDFGMVDNDPPGISIGNLIDNYSNSAGYYTDVLNIVEGTNNSVTITIKIKLK